MGLMVNRGKELIRISPKQPNRIEYSTNDGRSWSTRSSTNSYGDFIDLTDNGKELVAQTSKGFYFSKNEGRTWNRRSM